MRSRFEIKYAISLDQVDSILDRLSAFMKLDRHLEKPGFYRVTSLYFDTYQFRHYYDVINGERVRRKFRIRRYTLETDQVFFEVKHRCEKVISKDRILTDYRSAMEFPSYPDRVTDQRLEPHMFALMKERHFPVATVTYERLAMEDLLGSKVRATFDRNIRGGKRDMFDREVCQRDARILPLDVMIMELKFFEKIPSWLKRITRDFNLNPISYSKYTNTIDRIYNNRELIGGLTLNG